ncbi:MAG TPA: hypothetical protein VNP72_07155 [Longimicrobium sp.]|nr:hypothetical protein [Longimicrobium sp.]
MLRRTLWIVALAIMAVLGGPHGARAQQPYSTEPFTRMAALVPDSLDAERTRFMAWLSGSFESLEGQALSGAREHLYYLVGSAVRQNRLAEGGFAPEFPLADLAYLFEVGNALGLHGAGVVARALPLREEDRMADPIVPDSAGLHVELAAPMLRIRSDASGWRAFVPYYFMIGNVERFRARNGMPTEALHVSTLTTPHEGGEGHSQAAILLVSSPTQDVAAFNAFWMGNFRMSEADRVPEVPRPGATLYRGFDPAENMHKELLLLPTAKGAVAVFYAAVPGPYQANRVNFLDFIAHLQVP